MTGAAQQWLQPLLVRQWGQRYPQRSSQDTALLKTRTHQLSRILPQLPACTHVKSYYAPIDHHRLMNQLADYVTDRDSLNWLWQHH